MRTFYKEEKDHPILRSMGDGFFVARFSDAPRIDNGMWTEGGYLNVVVLRQTDLDLLWYKISVSEDRLKTYGGPLSDEGSRILSESKTTPIFIRTGRTRWIFDLYELEHDLAVLVSEEVETPELTALIGEEPARAILMIKDHPGLKKIVKFK